MLRTDQISHYLALAHTRGLGSTDALRWLYRTTPTPSSPRQPAAAGHGNDWLREKVVRQAGEHPPWGRTFSRALQTIGLDEDAVVDEALANMTDQFCNLLLDGPMGFELRRLLPQERLKLKLVGEASLKGIKFDPYSLHALRQKSPD